VSDDAPPPRGDRTEQSLREIPWKLVAWVAIAVYAVVFLLLNDERQDVSFVFFTVRTRLIWLILLSMALGAALAMVLPRWWRSRRERGAS
jgi:uncharacterized integral membrane protein